MSIASQKRAAVLLRTLAALVLVALVAIPTWLVATRSGRGHIAGWIASGLEHEIPGTVALDSLSFTGPDTLHVERLTFSSPGGRPVVDLRDVSIDVSVGAMLLGKFHADNAQVRGGEVNIDERPDGYTELEITFSKPGPAEGKPADLDIENVRFDDVTMNVNFADGGRVVAKELAGFLRIRNDPEKPGVVIRMDGVSGKQTEPSLAGMHFDLENVAGRVRGARREVLRLRGDLRTDDDHLKFDLEYANRKERPVVVKIDAVDTTPAFDVIARVADAFVLPSDVDLQFE
ncbi:MAG: hypothetical protein R3A78_12030 [Polyangiales bacterium]|nr:hypothetical protein [Myxococcales bacterium]